MSIRAALEEEAFNYSDDLPGDEMMSEDGENVYATPVNIEQHIEEEAEPEEAEPEEAVEEKAEEAEPETETE